MRALRVVGYGEDGVVILEDPDRRERFTVPADERLRAAARGDVQRLGQMSMDMESQLRPREIQARIRAGASVEQVAAAAGVPNQRIERFAYPVLLERSRMAELARAAHPAREDGPDVRTLAEVVESTFHLRGQEYAEAEWDSWRGEDNKWVVSLSWRVGRSDIAARWRYQPGSHGGTVSALDEHATDLVDGALARPIRRVGPVIDFSKPDERAGDGEGTGPGAAPGGTTAGSVADSVADPVADPVRSGPGSGTDQLGTGPARRATGTDQAGSGPTRRATGTDQTGTGSARWGDQNGPDAVRRAEQTGTGAGRRATKTTTGARAAGPGATPPADPDGGTPAADTAARRGGRKAKPVMPSWEDVLLGVKRN